MVCKRKFVHYAYLYATEQEDAHEERRDKDEGRRDKDEERRGKDEEEGIQQEPPPYSDANTVHHHHHDQALCQSITHVSSTDDSTKSDSVVVDPS